MVKVICILPAFNEESTISKIAQEAGKYTDEVIVVDDGSTDRTVEMTIKSDVIMVRHQKNRGKGAALRTGFKEALNRGADVLVTLDTDGEHDPKDIQSLVEPIKSGRADLVVGSRLQGQEGRSPLMRKISRRMTTLALKTLFGVRLTDTQSGFRGLSRKAAETIDFESDSFVAESEMLIDAARKGLRISELPITYIHVGGKFPVLKETSLFIWLCIKKILNT
jgi:glycosyltransferase involved in cell wall biosynthesis